MAASSTGLLLRDAGKTEPYSYHLPCPSFSTAAASFPLPDCCSDDEEAAAPPASRPRRPAPPAGAAGSPSAAEAAGLRACLAVQTKQVAALEGVVTGQAQRISQVC